MHLERNNLIQTGDLQDVEYYASLVYCESGAVAAESAILGIPTFHISSKRMGFLEELDKKYSLIIDRQSAEGTLELALEFLKDPELKEKLKILRENMIKENIDVTKFLIWFTENYPESKQIMIENPEYQLIFDKKTN